MKEYKFISEMFTDKLTKEVNKHIKQDWSLKEWKANDNVVIVLLEREKNNE